MTCIAIDDEYFALEIILLHAQKLPDLEVKGTFRSGLDALRFLQKESVDLIFLDINMPDLSGIDFIKALKNKYSIIFTTAYSEYALDGYSLNVVDYLLKPIEFPRFFQAVQKAQELYLLKQNVPVPVVSSAPTETVFLKSGQQIYPTKLKDILFMQSEGNYLLIYLVDDHKILIRTTIGEMLSTLPESDFIRVHKSYLAAFRHIQLIEKHQLKIKDFIIPISKTYQEALWRRLEK